MRKNKVIYFILGICTMFAFWLPWMSCFVMTKHCTAGQMNGVDILLFVSSEVYTDFFGFPLLPIFFSTIPISGILSVAYAISKSDLVFVDVNGKKQYELLGYLFIIFYSVSPIVNILFIAIVFYDEQTPLVGLWFSVIFLILSIMQLFRDEPFVVVGEKNVNGLESKAKLGEKEETFRGPPKKSKKAFLYGSIIVLCLILAATNPSEHQHQRVLLHEVSIDVGSDIAGDVGGFFGQIIGNFVGEGLENLNVSLFHYNNFILFSTITIRGEIVSFGILGQVITLNF